MKIYVVHHPDNSKLTIIANSIDDAILQYNSYCSVNNVNYQSMDKYYWKVTYNGYSVFFGEYEIIRGIVG
jgi:hypothetical protein